MTARTPAERSREYRRRQGIRARAVSTDPGLVARRKKRRGEPLTADEAEALRQYQRDAAARSRNPR